jgi:hypothetical protein
MTRLNQEWADGLAKQTILHNEIVTDRDGTAVETDVARWAEAEDVVRRVLASVWLAQRPDVRSLGVEARRDRNKGPADLALMTVEVFDPL